MLANTISPSVVSELLKGREGKCGALSTSYQIGIGHGAKCKQTEQNQLEDDTKINQIPQQVTRAATNILLGYQSDSSNINR